MDIKETSIQELIDELLEREDVYFDMCITHNRGRHYEKSITINVIDRKKQIIILGD